MNRVKIVTSEIAGFYPSLQWKKKMDDWYKDILEEKFTTFNTNKVIRLGIIHQVKRRTNWKWKEEAYDYLKNEKALASAVSIKENKLSRYNLETFKLPNTAESIRIFPKRLTQKEKNVLIEGELAKITGVKQSFGEKDDLELQFKTILREKDFDDIVKYYKVNRIAIKQLEQKFENRKDSLYKLMKELKLASFKCAMGNSYKINQKAPEFDIDLLVVSQVPKKFDFKYHILSKDGDVEVIDQLNNNQQFIFRNETMYEGQRISLYKGRIHVNGQRLRTDIREIFNNPNGFYPATGEILVDSDDLFRNCPISSTKIDGFLDLGLLDMKKIEELKYKESEDDVTEYFEVISETSEEARKNMFKEKLEARLALQKEKITPVFHESDYEDENEEEEIFKLEALF